MTKYIAFLRAINVGGHNKIKMDYLKELFESMGLKNVETFIASGNVIFDSNEKDRGKLEKKIEKTLLASLGYEVTTFIRTTDEIAAAAQYDPFPGKDYNEETATLSIGFLSAQPDPDTVKKLHSLQTPTDYFQINGTELYWLCLIRTSDSKVTGSKLEKTFGQQTTLRNSTTIRKLASKYKP